MNTPINSVFNAMDILRSYGHDREGLISIYYVLYCLHKGYRVYFTFDDERNVSDITLLSQDNSHFNDIVVQDFPIANIKSGFLGMPEKSIQKFFETISSLYIEKNYADIIAGLSNVFANNIGRSSGEFYTPDNIVRLIKQIGLGLNPKGIFNPYSKAGEIVSALTTIHTVGLEQNLTIATIARINIEAHGGNPEQIILGNPLTHSYPSECNSLISIPPFMMRLRDDEKEAINIPHPVHTAEEVLVWRFLEDDNYRSAVIVLPAGIGFSPQYRELRAALTEANCIDTIVSLPAGIFYSTGISTFILVLNKDKNNKTIRFIDGRSCFKKEQKRNILDSESIFQDYFHRDRYSESSFDVDIQQLRDCDYSFVTSMYSGYEDSVPEGYCAFNFNDVFRIPQMRMCTPFDEGYILKPVDFSRNLLEIMDFQKAKETGATSAYRKSMEPVQLALSFLGDEMRIVRLDGKADVFANSNQIPLVFQDNSPVVLEYAILSLLNNSRFSNLANNYSGMQLRRARDLVRYLDTIKLVAPKSKEEQVRLFDLELGSQKAEKAQSLKDELARLGTRETVSDLSHMMNTPFSNIGDLLGVLPDEEMSDNAKKWIVQLKDNFEYLKRLIKTVGADFSIDACPMESIEIQPFVSEYMQSWTNINHQFFKTELISNLSYDNVCVRGNDTLLRIALDCIFKNAQRHGFKNRFSEENKVSISLSEVNHLDKPFVCISIANNGEPFPESFTIKDFIKRGKVAGNYGKTGLGGYHVYSIIKRLGGFLNLTNDGNGEVIFELLIPAPGLSVKNINTYNNAEGCL